MDPIFADIIRTQRVITLAVLQVHLLNRHLEEIKTRYDHAQEMQLSMWVYKLRMRTLTVEGVKNVFVHFLEEQIEKLDGLREQQYAQDMETGDEWDSESSFHGADEELASLGL